MPSRELPDWLQGFLYYTKELECPDSFLKWSGLYTLSAATQRRIYAPWIQGWHYYPNLYVMLVGPPGVTHKNTAIKLSRKALREVGVPTGSEAISKEALIKQMRQRGKDSDALAILAFEFATFLRTSGHAMIEFLTDIYDSEEDFEYTTKSGGTDKVALPYLTFMGGCTPGWLAEEFDTTFIEGGFAARVLFVAEDAPRFRKAFPRVSPEMKEVYRKVLRDLEVILSLEGEFGWEPEAHKWFEDWYENILTAQEIDYRLKGYLTRKPTHLIRVVQLMTLTEGNVTSNSDMVVTVDRLKKSLAAIEMLEPSMVKAFKAVGKNPIANDLERIADRIADAGEIPEALLLEENLHALSRMQFDEVIKNLRDMGLVALELRGSKAWYVSI